jgi:hypothetical protein
MLKTFLLALALLIPGTWLNAQYQSPQDRSSQDSAMPGQTAQTPESAQSGNATSGQKTIEGCLQGSNGNYTLTDSSGMTYRLQGNDSELTKHNGHEVRVTGSLMGANSGTASSSTPSGGTNAAPTLTVDNLKHISKTCKSGMAQ